jgi:hypothetical protein
MTMSFRSGEKSFQQEGNIRAMAKQPDLAVGNVSLLDVNHVQALQRWLIPGSDFIPNQDSTLCRSYTSTTVLNQALICNSQE